MKPGKLMLLAIPLLVGFPQSLRADAIDDYVNAEIARQNVPGLTLMVMRDGQLVHAAGYGVANLEHNVPVHPDTLFKTGAVGMQFTAVGVMQLVDDGKVRLDDPIRKYFPEAPESWAPITVANLLNHTSGLPATPAGNFRTEYTEDEFLDIIYKMDLNFAAGSRWRFGYCNYILLGFLIKRVTGEPYSDFLVKRLFRPLGMQTARPIEDLAIIPNRATGYELRDGQLRNAQWMSATANSTADGSLYLSALDYAAWADSSLGQKALTARSWDAISHPARIASGRTYPYSPGWFRGRAAGRDIHYHAGSWQGFQSYMAMYPADRLTLVAVANGEGGDPAWIVGQVAAMLDPKYAQTPGQPIADAEPQVTSRVRDLLQRIAQDRTAPEDFVDFATRDRNSLLARYRRQILSMGELGEVALFARQDRGDDRVYRYRARYDAGVVDVAVGLAPDGRIGNLDIDAVHDWAAPVME